MYSTKTKESTILSGEAIQDSLLVTLNEHFDARGSFTEVFQDNWNSVINPVQWSMVKSEEGVLRGMHYHRRHDEYFCLIQGSCYLGLKDLRPESSTYLKSSLYYLTASDLKALIFPRGVVHGWYFIEPSLHLQAVSESYEGYGDEDNFGCRWDDPQLGIPWPFESAIISERANSFGSLDDLPPFYKGGL